MATAEQILAIAAGEIGAHDGAGKRNKYGAWFGLDGVAWCMEFVQWVYAQAGSPLPCRTASCGALLNWYRARQSECVVREPTPGCIVIFDFPGTRYRTDHTGIFVAATDTTITTIDGNTGGADDANGGWVRRRTRDLGYANPVYIRPRELTAPALDEQKEDEIMRYQTLDEIRNGAAYAAPTVEKLMEKGVLKGKDTGLDVSEDMLRLLVWIDRAGLLA
ncbi:MAG: CHAP domain-containing protein [Ruminococcaceae bacterium]|nr:CHAP domain-containing protein [Oscillospiraceae bacterium]